MRLIDADKIDFREVFKGESDFAKDTREAAQELINNQPTAYDVDKVILERDIAVGQLAEIGVSLGEKMDFVKEAMEKQIAKNPTPIDYKKYIDTVNNAISLRGAYWCPNCNHAVRSGDYCNDCGQALDWSDAD